MSQSRDFNFGPGYLMSAGVIVSLAGLIGMIIHWREK